MTGGRRSRRGWLWLALALAATQPACAADPSVTVGQRPQPDDDRYAPNVPGFKVTTWVTKLDTPWALAFLPDGRALVTERRGAIRLIDREGRLLPEPLTVRKVVQSGEGGLMGIAVHPRLHSFFYVMETVEEQRGKRENRVVRMRLEQSGAIQDRVIIGGIPAGANHNGGRIAFGPDGRLYVTTGDTYNAKLAQDKTSLAGKILRLSDDGTVPRDNPIAGSPVFSYGHRNPQGIAWDRASGKMLAAEHGPSGELGLSAFDEINVIEPGGNYGWPLAVGAAAKSGMIDPIVAWPDETTPPGGIAVWYGDLFVATLRSQALIRVNFNREGGGLRANIIERWFAKGGFDGRFGRLRDAMVGPDNALYVMTSNRDGRGRPAAEDDRIIRIELLAGSR